MRDRHHEGRSEGRGEGVEDILRWLLERRVRRLREDRRHRNAGVPNNFNEGVDAFLETLGLAKDDRRDEEKECKTFSDGYLVLREADTVPRTAVGVLEPRPRALRTRGGSRSTSWPVPISEAHLVQVRAES